ncbi:alpha-ketoglutarate-dependent dioxygenase AlkB [Burkholderia cepacia]|uniref:alpha-ketoglutarate-dependent dioxygenase AlkB n=1 Tax=Burkholderia cepacia TaxID=292 RepID=UPI0019050318|nr:alpha-ketoglutarate-dependent dioxygenase AlkB [Burkholderia cepacia]MBJ9752100.1 alpha-ketoglutarate-dependent dioxygenase AlkB [Burkholderia cepacia]
MTRETATQMDWLSPNGEADCSRGVAGGVAPRLVLALDNRDWLRFLVDEWWPTRVDASGVSLGVEAACGEPARTSVAVMVSIDPTKLPAWPVAIYGNGQWRHAPLDSIVVSDTEVCWPGPIPLSAVTSFSVSTEKERARLLAMAKGFSNVELPSQPIEIKTSAFNPPAPHQPVLERLYAPPIQWNAMRGAAAMALWAVPTIDPWLDVYCEVLSVEPSREKTATALGAPWLDVPPWMCATKDDGLMPLWAAIQEVLGAVNYRHEWRPTEVLDAIVESATQLGADAEAMSDLQANTHAVLADKAVVDVRRAERDPLGLALQLVLLRPMADQFVRWTDDLRAMPPSVWWTGAMLAGLLTGMRDLEGQFRGSAVSRHLLAVRTWRLGAASAEADLVWPDAFALKPSWTLNGSRVHFLEAGRLWAERKPSRRGDWFRANYEDEATYRQAIDVAGRLNPSSLRRCLRISDVDLTVSGNGKLSLDKAGRRIRVKGEVNIALDEKVSLDDELDVDQFRDWIAVGSVAERLPIVPDSGRSGLQEPPASPSVAEADAAKQIVRLPDDPPGLSTMFDFISEDEELALIAQIGEGQWLNDLSRRVQHYGWKYDYRARNVDPASYLGPLPQWAAALAQRLVKYGLVAEEPDQVIVNEYVGSQGIAKHVDCPECFRGPIVTISLGESWGMVFRRLDAEHKVERMLQRRSVVVLDGEVRNRWTHEIPKRKKEGALIRGRRISITFRKIGLSTTKPKRKERRTTRAA